ncbi:MAG: type IV pilus twitching motility protein PilT, partial [Planctomycetota bacterium]
MNLSILMARTLKLGCSDLHLQPGLRPRHRLQGELVDMDGQAALNAQQVEELMFPLLNERQRARLKEQGHLDFSHTDQEGVQWRCHCFEERCGLSAALRPLARQVPSLKELKLPSQLERLAQLRSGLVLFAGATGCGKSTTLASIIDLINQTQARTIITIEDPIEYVHDDKRSLIQQRTVGIEVPSFQQGVIDALSERPNVLVVGELRDYETIRAALTAAELGTLVLGTVHSVNAAQTVERLLDVFDPTERSEARVMLSFSLEAVISQVLLNQRTGKGRVPACEVMFLSSAIAELIRKDKVYEIPTCIQTSRSSGMILMDEALSALVAARKVTTEEAIGFASNPQRFRTPHARPRRPWYLGGGHREPEPRKERRREPRVKAMTLVNVGEQDEV